MPYRFWFIVFFILVGIPPLVEAKIQSKAVPYTYGESSFEGFLAWDDSVKGQRPGILVVHEWWGLNEYARSRTEQLAGLGYIAFAVDMYGKGKVTTHPEKAGEWAKLTTANVDEWLGRANKGLKLLQADPKVDPTRLAAIGYCFGGATVMQLVYRSGPGEGGGQFPRVVTSSSSYQTHQQFSQSPHCPWCIRSVPDIRSYWTV